MKTIVHVILLILLFIMISSCGYNDPSSKLTICIVDESDKPIEGAEIAMGFHPPKTGMNDYIIKGISDINGVFSASHKNLNDSIGFKVTKLGYYDSHGGHHFSNVFQGKWQPWDPKIKVVLRKIVKPVPMYARDIHMSNIVSKMKIPVIGKDVGFDLVEYAWLPPYGNGKHADFIFNLKRKYVDDKNFNCTLNLKFNKYDGIQKVNNPYSVSVVNQYNYHSDYILPRNAPEHGYAKELILPFRYGKGNTEIKDNYIFRVRSKVSGEKIVGMYGKIVGDILFDPRGSKTATISFKYYLNPDYTTNLEFDPKRNLFTDLKSFEQVGL